MNLSYDGHIRNALNLPLDIFITFTVACATEFPADALLTATLDRWGRRWYGAGTMILSGIFTLAVIPVPKGWQKLELAFSNLMLKVFLLNISEQ